jgi:hypothetical protein
MKKNLKLSLLLICMLFAMQQANSQIAVKLNTLYAVGGVVNPAVEFKISPKYTFQTEVVLSPWLGINIDEIYHPLKVGIFMNEVRRYFKEANKGWYIGVNGAMMGFNLSKPEWNHGIKLKNVYGKGYGFMVGVAVGYEYVFGKKDNWLLDAYFGFSRMWSMYNEYDCVTHEITMYPHREVQPNPPDPWNGSAEWYPNKIGLSIGYKF